MRTLAEVSSLLEMSSLLADLGRIEVLSGDLEVGP